MVHVLIIGSPMEHKSNLDVSNFCWEFQLYVSFIFIMIFFILEYVVIHSVLDTIFISSPIIVLNKVSWVWLILPISCFEFQFLSTFSKLHTTEHFDVIVFCFRCTWLLLRSLKHVCLFFIHILPISIFILILLMFGFLF